ncbi:hypothetical protein YC2023_017317 [Brassica napus]
MMFRIGLYNVTYLFCFIFEMFIKTILRWGFLDDDSLIDLSFTTTLRRSIRRSFPLYRWDKKRRYVSQ